MFPIDMAAQERSANLHYAMYLNGLQNGLQNLTPEERKNPASIRAFSVAVYTAAGNFIDGLPRMGEATRRAVLKKDLMRIVTQNAVQTIHQAKFGAALPTTPLEGAMGLLLARRAGDVTLNYRGTDSAGRSYNSTMLVAFLIKDFLYQTHIDDLIAEAKEEGVKNVTITHPGEGNEFTDKTMSLVAMLAQRDTIFHPNSSSSFHAAI